MIPELQILLAAIMLIVCLLSPLLAWWGSNRYHIGRFEQIQANTREWRLTVEERLKNIDARLEQSSWGVLSNRMGRAEQDIADIRRTLEERLKPLHERIEVVAKRTYDLGNEITRLPGAIR